MLTKVTIYGILPTYGDISSNYVSFQVCVGGGQNQTGNTVPVFFKTREKKERRKGKMKTKQEKSKIDSQNFWDENVSFEYLPNYN
jgi:hypothetical protein